MNELSSPVYKKEVVYCYFLSGNTINSMLNVFSMLHKNYSS